MKSYLKARPLKSRGRSTQPKIRGSMGVVGLVLALIALTVGVGGRAGAATAPDLGTAETFAVLAGSTVTNTGSSLISGDLGVSPGTAVTGFPPGTVVNGTIHANDAVAIRAQDDALIAYNALEAEPCTQDLTGQDLGGLTLTPGVYCFSSSAQLTGDLTLDAQGDPNAVFIFKIGTTLTTAPGSSVVLINGADPCNVFFQVGSSATLGTTTTFVGTIVALQSITAQTGASVQGRLLALNGAVTLDTNNVTRPDCTAPPTTSTTSPTTSTTSPTTSTTSPTTSTTSPTTSTTSTSTTLPPTGTTTSSTSSTVPSTTTTTRPSTTTTTRPSTTTTTRPSTTTTTRPSTGTTTSSTTTTTGAGGGGETATTTTTTVGDGGRKAPGGPTASATPEKSRTLPKTGSPVRGQTVAGMLAIALGSVVLLVNHRRRGTGRS